MPIFLLSSIISPVIIVMIPRPPICIKTKMTICPNVLQAEDVVSVTRPVTQVEVVAVKSASMYGTGSLLAELIGNDKSKLPNKMVTRKLNNTICVVDNVNFFFFTMKNSPIKHKGTNILCSQLVPFIFYLSNYITSRRFCQ